MTDLHKLKDRAQLATARGKHREAIALYRQIADHEPDADWLRRAGEAARRAGMGELAVEHFFAAADRYAADGFLQKAAALARLVLQLDPRHTRAANLIDSLRVDRAPVSVA